MQSREGSGTYLVYLGSWKSRGGVMYSRMRPSTPHIAVWLLGGDNCGAVDGKYGLRVHGALGGNISERNCAGGCS